MSYRRALSPVERAWVVAAERFPPFCNQLVLEGEGDLDVATLDRALQATAEVNPGARVRLRGALCRAAWVAEVETRAREVDGSGWDGRSEEGAPFLRDPLPPLQGPTTEVLLVTGNPCRLVLRTAHATMDGGGTLAFADDLFRALRAEPLVGHPDTVTDLALARASGQAKAPWPQNDCLPAPGPPEGEPAGVLWRRLTLDVPPRGLLARLALGVARHARRFGEGPVRIDVPADLRRQRPELRSTANLAGVVAIEVMPEDSLSDVEARLRDRLQGGPGAAILTLAPLLHLPLWLMRAGSRQGEQEHLRTGRYGSTAVVSNLGRLDVSRWEAPGFRTRTAFFVPPGTEVTALFVALSGTPEGVELAFTVPRHLVPGDRLQALTEALRDAATGTSPD